MPEATVSRQVITSQCPQVPEDDSQAGQSCKTGPSGLAGAPRRSSDVTASGLGMDQWSRGGVGRQVPSSQLGLLRQPLGGLKHDNKFPHLSRSSASSLSPPMRKRLPGKGVQSQSTPF